MLRSHDYTSNADAFAASRANKNLTVQAGPNVYYSAGKYPLIKASKIDREKFNLCFFVGTDGMDLTQEQKGFFHLEFDDTTVWLVIDQDAVAP